MSKRTVMAATLAASTALLAACGGGSEAGSVPDDCQPAHEFETISDGKLTVAAYDLPPFTRIDGDKLVGVDGVILQEIAAMECLEIEVMSAAAAAIIPAVQAGRADVAAGDWYRTAERAEIVDLSDPIYTDQMAIVGEVAPTAIPELEGEKVGTVDGYLWVADMKAYLGDSLSIYNSPLNMYQDLNAGRIDYAIDSYGSGVFNTEGEDVEVVVADSFEEVAASTEGAQSSFPVPKGSEGLLTAINEDIAELRESGRLAEILVEHDLDKSAAEPGEARLIGD
ncbi:substrate-binding periplasmic protein [Ornithinimicrobium cavernae]|uniref:substrate-binding periplasmic protein n=1 Tax=Ornithinimicrobium cavernae TaxID=2666047 RepID=UPI000D68CE0D|nr:ABC transporter substrate-binding protein [Ornithinimicrobium cavernae]